MTAVHWSDKSRWAVITSATTSTSTLAPWHLVNCHSTQSTIMMSHRKKYHYFSSRLEFYGVGQCRSWVSQRALSSQLQLDWLDFWKIVLVSPRSKVAAAASARNNCCSLNWDFSVFVRIFRPLIQFCFRQNKVCVLKHFEKTTIERLFVISQSLHRAKL